VSEQNLRNSRGLARSFAIWIGGFFLIAALLLLGWTHWLQRQDSLRELRRLAETNANFISDLGFPLSPQLASQLSEILDLGVGFYFDDTTRGNWPPEVRRAIPALVQRGQLDAVLHGNWEIAISPVTGKTGYLVLLRERSKSAMNTGAVSTRFLIPVAVLALGCGALAFGLGRSVVNPLQVLTRWLPNLPIEDGSDLSDIPKKISSRRDEVGALARALSDTSEQLKKEKEIRARAERMAALGRIATSLAHEVKNPAAAIRMHADLLLAGELSGTGGESIGLIRGEVDQITDLVNQWLYVSKAAPPAMRRHDLCELVERVVARMKPTMVHRGVEVEIDMPDSPLFIDVDAPRIEQVLRNLIQNAIDAMSEGGIVRLKLKESDSKAVLTVSDEGPGFSEAALSHFGEPFFSEREGGMGIGLTLACEVIDAHGGSILPIAPETGGKRSGGTVSLELPISNQSTDA